MSEPTPPTSQPHHNYKSWTSTWRDANGRSHSKRFGRVGEVPKSQAVNRWKAWLQSDYDRVKARQSKRYSVEQLCQDWFTEMQKGYVVDGKFTATINRMKVAMESFATMYGHEEADDMTAAKVAAWMEAFILTKRKHGGKGPKTKHTANLALNYVKRAFVWGMTRKEVAQSAAGAVALIRTVRGDHLAIRRKARIKAIAWDVVEATCKKLPANVRAMVELQWWTGMRPGEVMRLRPCDIDMSGEVWVYTPAHHKNSWREKERHIPIGPQGRAVLEKHLPSKTDEWVFRRPDGKRFDRQSYARAIANAATEAKVETWAPNRIRHSYATRVRLLHGPQAVADMLGHANLNQQAVYVEDAILRAKRIAKEVG